MTTHAARVIHLFDNSYFSEFGTFGITDRASDAPADLRGQFWAQTFATSPNATYMVKGPVPPRPEDLEMLLAATMGCRIDFPHRLNS